MIAQRTPSTLAQVAAIGAIMPHLILREKMGFSLFFALIVMESLLEFGIPDALNDWTEVDIVISSLSTIIFMCSATATQRRLHRPAKFPSIWRAFQLGWAELIYAIVYFVITMVILLTPMIIVAVYYFWKHGPVQDEMLLSVGLLFSLVVVCAVLVGIGTLAVNLPRVANGIFKNIGKSLNATKGYRIALGIHWSVQFLLAAVVYAFGYYLHNSSADIARTEVIEILIQLSLYLIAFLQPIHMLAVSSASAFYIFDDDPSGLRNLTPEAADPA